MLAEAAALLEAAGADFLVVCTNTMHKVADAIEAAVDIPLLHIADPTGAGDRRRVSAVGLLGTRFTMEEDFYRGRLESHHGIEALVPAEDRDEVHRIIYDELCVGVISADGRARSTGEVIARLVERGAEAIILGCTEIRLLVGPPIRPCRCSIPPTCMRAARRCWRA